MSLSELTVPVKLSLLEPNIDKSFGFKSGLSLSGSPIVMTGAFPDSCPLHTKYLLSAFLISQSDLSLPVAAIA